MQLEKAIAIVINSKDMAQPFRLPGYEEAIKLLIEAGKAVIECRKSHMFCPGLTLPGETP